MKSEWREATLSEAVSLVIDHRGLTPKKLGGDWAEKGYRALSAKNVKTGRIVQEDAIRFVSEQMYRRWMPDEIEKNDIIITSEAPFGEILLWNTEEKIVLSQRLFGVRISRAFDPVFLYYYMLTDQFQGEMRARATGTTVIGLRQPELLKCRIRYPRIEDQKKIASILRSFDDKIELNNRINENLTEQIHTLCNAWLNDYIPFGGECPDDWELTPLSSIARFISGYSYKGNELKESSVAMATIKNFDRHGGFKLDGYKEILPSSKLKPEHHVAMFDTLVAHTDLTQNAEVIGNAEPVLSFSGYGDIIFSMDVVKVLPNNPEISKFLIAAMLQTQQFKGHCLGYVNGTTVLHLSKKALPEYSLMLPKDFSILKPLDEAVSSMYQQMAVNIDENVQLAKLRDSLLPRLMSGELDVSDLDL